MRPTPGSASRNSSACSRGARSRKPRSRPPVSLLDHVQDLLDPLRLDLRDATRPDRLLHLGDRRGGDLRPARRSAIAAGRRRRRGSGRSCSARGSSGRARRAARDGARCAAGRSRRAAGRGSIAAARGPAASRRWGAVSGAQPKSYLQAPAAAKDRAGILPSMTGARSASLERPSWVPAVSLSALLAVTLAAWDPHVRDLAAHAYREELFERSGFAIWNGSWYGGHYLLTHSVLFPPLAALFGAQVVGVAVGRGSAYLFDRLVCERWGETRPSRDALVRRRHGDDARQRPAQLRARRRIRARKPARASARKRLDRGRLGRVRAREPGGGRLPGGRGGSRRTRVAPSAAACAAGSRGSHARPGRAAQPRVRRGGQEPFAFSAWIALPLWCGGALYVTRGWRPSARCGR